MQQRADVMRPWCLLVWGASDDPAARCLSLARQGLCWPLCVFLSSSSLPSVSSSRHRPAARPHRPRLLGGLLSRPSWLTPSRDPRCLFYSQVCPAYAKPSSSSSSHNTHVLSSVLCTRRSFLPSSLLHHTPCLHPHRPPPFTSSLETRRAEEASPPRPSSSSP